MAESPGMKTAKETFSPSLNVPRLRHSRLNSSIGCFTRQDPGCGYLFKCVEAVLRKKKKDGVQPRTLLWIDI